MATKIPYPQKRLGQVFLRDSLVVEQILQCADLAPTDTVLEIGPGRGILTTALAPRVAALYALEIDVRYVQALTQHFAATPHVHILRADARSYDYRLLPQPFVVVANLPYSVGMAIVQHLLSFHPQVLRLIIMLQKEVVDRLLAPPDSSAYGALSVFVQYAAQLTHQFEVSRQAFSPVPAVDSTVISMVPFAVSPWPACDPAWLFRVVKHAFAHRRKTLRANLLAAFPTALTRSQVTEVLTTLALTEHARAQELTVLQFVHLSQVLRQRLQTTTTPDPLGAETS